MFLFAWGNLSFFNLCVHAICMHVVVFLTSYLMGYKCISKNFQLSTSWYENMFHSVHGD